MCELRINGHADDFGVALAKIFNAIREREDFRGTHECKIERVKEEHQFLAFEIRQRNLLEFPIEISVGRKIRRRRADKSGHTRLLPSDNEDDWDYYGTKKRTSPET